MFELSELTPLLREVVNEFLSTVIDPGSEEDPQPVYFSELAPVVEAEIEEWTGYSTELLELLTAEQKAKGKKIIRGGYAARLTYHCKDLVETFTAEDKEGIAKDAARAKEFLLTITAPSATEGESTADYGVYPIKTKRF